MMTTSSTRQCGSRECLSVCLSVSLSVEHLVSYITCFDAVGWELWLTSGHSQCLNLFKVPSCIHSNR